MQLGRREEALPRFEEAVALFSTWLRPEITVGPQSHSDYGIALFMVGKREEAIASLQRAHGLGSKSAETFIYLGISLKDQKRYREAESCLKEALDAAPGDAMAQQLLGEVLELQGAERYVEAVQSYYAAAFALAAGGKLDLALEPLEHALVLQPDNAVMLSMKAELFRLLSRNEEAVQIADQALSLNSNDMIGQLFTTRSGALQALGRFEEALQDADKSLAQNPENAMALGFKGQALHSLNRNQEALEFLRKSIELEPDMDWVHAEVAAVHLDSGAYKEALSSIDLALKINPQNVWAIWIKGETLRNLGQFQEALEVFDQGLTLRPDSPSLYTSKAGVLRVLGRPDEALVMVDQALTLVSSPYVLGVKGEILRTLGRHEEAVKVLRESIAADPNQSWVHANLGESLFRLGQVDEALKSFDAALQDNPDDPWTLRAKAEVLASQNKHDEAIPLLKHSIEIDPSPAAYSQLSELLQATQRLPEALDVIDRGAQLALEQNPNDLKIMVVRGQVLNALGRYDEAITVLRQSISINPDLDVAHAELGNALLETGAYEEALSELDQALRLNEENSKALQSKGRALLMLSREQEAIEPLRRSAELEPDALTYITLGAVLRETDQLDEAQKVLDQGLSLDPQNAFGLLTMGQVLHSLNRTDEALKVIQDSIKFDAGNYLAHAELASILFDLKQNDAALSAANKSLELKPQNAFALGKKADIQQTLGALEDARKTIEEALALAPDNSWLLLIKGQVLSGLGEHEEAIESFDRVLSESPDDVVVLHHKGIALLGLNRNDQAVAVFERVLTLDPQHVTVMATMAFTLLFDDKYSEEKLDKALRYLDQALELDPDNAWALYIKGSTLCDLGDYAESVDALKRSAELDKTDVDCRTYLGWALQCQSIILIRALWEQQLEKDFPEKLSLKEWVTRSEADVPLQKAEEAYRAALEIDEHNLWAQKGVANIRYLLGDEDGARKIYQQVLDAAESSGDFDAPTLSLIGWCRYRLKQYDDAVRLFIDNQSLIADMAAAQFDLALALFSSKQYSPGLGQYERGVKVARERPERRFRGLLSVARGDLLEAAIYDPSMCTSEEVKTAFALLETGTTPVAATSS
jgi:tetratricopeptide (TPR) repeat protein